jgi:hypothetical protein
MDVLQVLHILLEIKQETGQWWRVPLIPALERQRVRGHPGLQSEFQDSQGYTEKPCLEKPKKKKKKMYPVKMSNLQLYTKVSNTVNGC